jgi:heme exporter protein B
LEILKILFFKEFQLELKRKSIVAGLAIYLFCTVFICYLTFALRQNLITPLVWGALFWITILFSAVNTVAKSFLGEKKGNEIYFYSIAKPEAIVLSKILYNFILCCVMSLTGFGLFILFLDSPINDYSIFLILILLTSFGFSASLTLLSGIAAKANNSNILMAILSFPVIISIILMAVKVTKNCIDGLDRSASWDEMITLLAINCVVAAASYLLFPYIWRS